MSTGHDYYNLIITLSKKESNKPGHKNQFHWHDCYTDNFNTNGP